MRLLTTEAVIREVNTFRYTRVISSLHVHHTLVPDHEDWERKQDWYYWQKAMERYHKMVKKYRFIAQHYTLLPNGMWVTGRSLNEDPASMSGYNKGVLMVEMFGNFDLGHDIYGGEQAHSMDMFAANARARFGIPIRFHRDFPKAGKTCPGTGINRDQFMAIVESYLRSYEEIASTNAAYCHPMLLRAVNERKNSKSYADEKNYVNGNFFWYKGAEPFTIGWLVSAGVIQNANNVDEILNGAVRKKGTFIVKRDGTVICERMSNSEISNIRYDLWFCCQGFSLFPVDLAGEGYDPNIGYETWRPAIGWNKKKNMVVIAVRPRTTADRIGKTMRNLGCESAIGLDGGSSTNCNMAGKTIINQKTLLTNIIKW